ncbi:MAG: SDR family oxidoreductase [Cyanobacteriota bacterium]|nr:SDR family oxidoreductase [Cyanobacteriota bacterium]
MNSSHLRRLIAVPLPCPAASAGQPSPETTVGQHLLIVDDGSALVVPLSRQLRASGWQVLLLSRSGQRVPAGRPAPVIEVGSQPTELEAMVQRLRQVSGGLAGILSLHTQPHAWDDHWLEKALGDLRLAIGLARAISLQTDPLSFLYFVTAQGGHFGLGGNPPIDALATGLEGLPHPLRMEMPKTSFRSIDLDPATPLEAQAEEILTEIRQPDQPYRTAYGWRQGQRSVLSVRQIPANLEPPPLSQNSVVVFAGGARGIGAVCAQSLAERIPCTLIFLGRTELTPEIEELSRLSPPERLQRSEAFGRDYKAAHPGCLPRIPRELWRKKMQAVEAVETLRSLETLGSQVAYYATDVRDPLKLQQVFQTIQQRYGRPDMVVHVAGLGGVETDRLLMRKEWSVIDQVIETKVTGAIHLLKAAEAQQVPLFIGFGSIASRFGNSGQVDYASANALLHGIVRAHNARGVLPVAKVLAWGAWDEVGIAVSGPTKQMLINYGVQFIAPKDGGSSFVQELSHPLSPSSPAEVYLSPSWAGLDQLLQENEAMLTTADPPRLLGSILHYEAGQSLKAEHVLEAKGIPFLDHHRYDGTAWVPAVMGMEVAVEAAASLFPDLQPFALRQVALKKAVRLVRDESVTLITEAHRQPPSPLEAQETIVQVTVSARYKDRTWVFAEMQVVLSAARDPIEAGLQDGHLYHGGLPIEQEPGEVIQQSHADLYPSPWLRFQTYGSTFQVIQSMAMNLAAGRTQGQMVTDADLKGCCTPLTLIDGVFQAYGVLISTMQGSWCGPPLGIGEIRWLPGTAQTRQVSFQIRVNLADKDNFPILHMQDEQGRCILRMQGAEQGGTSVKALTEQVKKSAAPPVTPYLGSILEEQPGQRLRAQQILDPLQEKLLQDHKFSGFVLVPAVYFMEVAVEAAARLQPDPPPTGLRNFQIHQMFHLLAGSQSLITEAEQIKPGETYVKLFSQQKSQLRLHAEGLVTHSSPRSLGSHPIGGLPEIRTESGEWLYAHRFPNGPIFQVIDKMILAEHHQSLAYLRLTSHPHPQRWLPLTLLDGAFQVDSATRSGFDHPSGLPKTVEKMDWTTAAPLADQVICLSSTRDGSPAAPGALSLTDRNGNILLQMTGISLTPVLPTLGARS